MTRREALAALAGIPIVAAGFGPISVLDAETTERAAAAAETALASGAPYVPKFFTAHEWQTARLLADMIIPRDARSGSASDAGAPEFMDYILSEYPDQQLPMRGGLAWLDAEAERRFGVRFAEATLPDRRAILDDVAWPARARPEMGAGAAFFSRFRDLTAAGFWSSPMGIRDIGYIGNTGLAEWTGCPPEALRSLGVSYPAEAR